MPSQPPAVSCGINGTWPARKAGRLKLTHSSLYYLVGATFAVMIAPAVAGAGLLMTQSFLPLSGRMAPHPASL